MNVTIKGCWRAVQALAITSLALLFVVIQDTVTQFMQNYVDPYLGVSHRIAIIVVFGISLFLLVQYAQDKKWVRSNAFYIWLFFHLILSTLAVYYLLNGFEVEIDFLVLLGSFVIFAITVFELTYSMPKVRFEPNTMVLGRTHRSLQDLYSVYFYGKTIYLCTSKEQDGLVVKGLVEDIAHLQDIFSKMIRNSKDVQRYLASHGFMEEMTDEQMQRLEILRVDENEKVVRYISKAKKELEKDAIKANDSV